jgi:hypothetical protein
MLRTACYLKLKKALLFGAEICITHLAVKNTITLLKIDFGGLLSAMLLKMSFCEFWLDTNGLNLSENYSDVNY